MFRIFSSKDVSGANNANTSVFNTLKTVRGYLQGTLVQKLENPNGPLDPPAPDPITKDNITNSDNKEEHSFAVLTRSHEPKLGTEKLLNEFKDGEVIPADFSLKTNNLILQKGEVLKEPLNNKLKSIQQSQEELNKKELSLTQSPSIQRINGIDQLLLQNKGELEKFIFDNLGTNEKWATIALSLKEYCTHLSDPQIQISFSKIPSFKECFPNLVIALLEYYYARQAAVDVFWIKLAAQLEVSEISKEQKNTYLSSDPGNSRKLSDLTESLDDGFSAIKEAFSGFKEIVKTHIDYQFIQNELKNKGAEAEKNKIDEEYNFEDLCKSVQMITSIDVLNVNIKKVEGRVNSKREDGATSSAITTGRSTQEKTWYTWFWGATNSEQHNNDTSNNKSLEEIKKNSAYKQKFLEKLEKIQEEVKEHRNWDEYFTENKDPLTTEGYFRKIKNLSAVIATKKKPKESLEDQKTDNIFKKLNDIISNKEKYKEKIKELETSHPLRESPADKLDAIVQRLSSQKNTPGNILEIIKKNINTRKSKSYSEAFRNLFWLNGFSFFSPYHEYQKNREAISEVRKKVYEQYGSLAVKRFDYHFAYRYRLGAPLTTTALTKFLNHEKELNGLGSVISIDIKERDDSSHVETLEKLLLEKITNLAADEFESSFGKIDQEEDRTFLYHNFLEQFVKRPLDIVENEYNPIIVESGVLAFLGSRFNAMYTSFFAGNNKNENQKTIKLMEDMILREKDINSNEVKNIIEEKLKAKKITPQAQVLTFQDVCLISSEIENLKKQHNTFYNNYIRGPVRWLANSLATAGVVESMAHANTPIAALFTGAAATGVSMAVSPEQRLLLGLGMLYSAKSSSGQSGESSWYLSAAQTAARIGLAPLTFGMSYLVI